MKAIVFREINSLPKIEEIHITADSASKVKLNYAALNHRDIWITKGLYPGLVPGTIMGADGVGIYNGNRVIIYPALHWGGSEAYQAPNFKVLGVPDHGTFAENIFTDEKNIFTAPAHLSDAEAAALPIAGLTAYRALFTKAQLRKEDKVLITGIGGGVAIMAALMAKANGNEVYFTTGSDSKIAKALTYGLKEGFNYKNENHFEQIKETVNGIDVIIDGSAGSSFSKYIALCNYGARIVFYGGGQGKIQNLNPQPIFWKQINIMGSTMGSFRDFEAMLSFVDEHKIRPVVDSIYDFESYADAFSRLESGNQFGKVVIKIN